MNELVSFLTNGDHPVQVSLRPEKTFQLFQACVDRGYVHVKFTDTRGGTELGVPLDRDRSDLAALQGPEPAGEVRIVGDLTLDYVPVTCVAKIDLQSLAGTAHLRLRSA